MSPVGSLSSPSVSYSGSERSGCILTIYRAGRQDLSFVSRGLGPSSSSSLPLDGTDNASGARLVTCSTSNSIGNGGQWRAVFMSDPSKQWDPFDELEVDSWVDISMLRGGVAWHVMRGMLTDIRVSESASGGGGATVRTVSVSGSSFQRVWQTTLWWFSSIIHEGGSKVESIKSIGVDRLIGTPNANVKNILFNFFASISQKGRANWNIPSSMPGSSGTAASLIKWDDSGFDPNYDGRYSPSATSVYPNVDLWSMAQEYQDGMFCELFTDVLPAGGVTAYAADPTMRDGLSPSRSCMTAIFRDKPFAVATEGVAARTGTSSPFFSLPTHTVPRSSVQGIDLGVSSQEAFNSFSFSPHFGQEQLRKSIEAQYCLWNPSLMSRRGMRKLDASTMYKNFNLELLYRSKRTLLRDWYCLGYELLQGSIELGRGFPEIRVGSRIVVVGPQADDRITFYVEGVRHTCQHNGMQTSLDVTRGYRGTDASHVQRISQESAGYKTAI